MQNLPRNENTTQTILSQISMENRKKTAIVNSSKERKNTRIFNSNKKLSSALFFFI